MNLSQKCRIGWIETGRGDYGGQIYNRLARKALEAFCQVEHVSIRNKILPGSLAGNAEIFCKLTRLSGEQDIWIRETPALVAMNTQKTKGANIALIHHDDFSGYPPLKRFLLEKLRKRALPNLSKCGRIVIVSQFWRDHFLKQGFKNLSVIYNAFDMNDYNISDEDAAEFAKRERLSDKPVIYIGNCQKAKGVVEAHHALKELDVHLLTSGPGPAVSPARNLEGSYEDYLKLLKAASLVVTMSKFDEGWCRTAHEAMLLKTPVIGSGRGGMKELLQDGGQIVCEDFKNLKKNVSSVLDSKQKSDDMAASGHEFAKKFTLQRFQSAWKEAIEQTLSPK